MKRSQSRSPDGDVEVEGARCHPPAAKSSPLPSPMPTEPCSLNFVPTPVSANVPVYSILDTTFIKGSVDSQVNTFVVYVNPLYYQLSSLPPANWTFVCWRRFLLRKERLAITEVGEGSCQIVVDEEVAAAVGNVELAE
ncbi:hypothetical protein VKT23_012777 [Stygiomarasmius scandens]|uniref:Uncharacterized protein n=1 Tax=Marasmiellus scandens TaxID=2682957 RepID=A0ABR1J9V6_9AGAR